MIQVFPLVSVEAGEVLAWASRALEMGSLLWGPSLHFGQNEPATYEQQHSKSADNVMHPLCRTHTPLVTFSYLMVSKLY